MTVTQARLIQLKLYVSSQERQLYQAKASARQLSVSRYVRSLLDADIDGQIERSQRIDRRCRHLVRNLAALQLMPNPHTSDLFQESIALVQEIQQEVRQS